MISDESYANFFQNIGKLALAVINNENKLKKIQRLYWFTIEFGLMNTPNGEKIYGAGIISSKKELENVYSKNSIKKQFDISAILNKEYRIDKVQNEYFVIESFDQLSSSLEEVQKELGVTF
jgi:phenylalanine-4-hydroxylase